jgi:hypothetical protein
MGLGIINCTTSSSLAPLPSSIWPGRCCKFGPIRRTAASIPLFAILGRSGSIYPCSPIFGPTRPGRNRNRSPASPGHATSFLCERGWHAVSTSASGDGIDLALQALDLLLHGDDAVELGRR